MVYTFKSRETRAKTNDSNSLSSLQSWKYRLFVETMIEIFDIIDTLMQCANISNKSHYFLLHLSIDTYFKKSIDARKIS